MFNTTDIVIAVVAILAVIAVILAVGIPMMVSADKSYRIARAKLVNTIAGTEIVTADDYR